MFERFTEEARQVVVLAQEEARALRHSYIGTEHLLLGLLRDEEQRDEGAGPLESLGITLDDARTRITRIVGLGEETGGGQIPFTPRAKKVLELALREALSLGHNWIGPEHILLGIARENEGVASRVLLDLDADSLRIRNAVIRTLSELPPQTRVPTPVGSRVTRPPMDAGWFDDGLADVLATLAREIRHELGREPDVGDLLLTIACARESAGGQALQELGVDLDALWVALERIRQSRTEEREGLVRKVDEVRAQKREALQREQVKEAAALRDKLRALSEQLRSLHRSDDKILKEARRRLGLPTPAE